MRTDYKGHKVLFTILAAAHSSALENNKPLPKQRIITGHKHTDAYIWGEEVIRLNEPAHLEAAESALKKIKISLLEVEERYSRYLLANFIDDHPWCWTAAEKKYESITGSRMNEIGKQRCAMVDVYRDVLPVPNTLSDVVREFVYWDWLCCVRHTAGKELGYEFSCSEHHESAYDHERCLEQLLATIKPVTCVEAIEVCCWFLASKKRQYMENHGAAVIFNQVGECEE